MFRVYFLQIPKQKTFPSLFDTSSRPGVLWNVSFKLYTVHSEYYFLPQQSNAACVIPMVFWGLGILTK